MLTQQEFSVCSDQKSEGLVYTGAAIEPREVERTREGQEEFVVWEKRRRRIGLCRFSEYYVGRPTSRTTTESYKETVFELKPDQIKVCTHQITLKPES